MNDTSQAETSLEAVPLSGTGSVKAVRQYSNPSTPRATSRFWAIVLTTLALFVVVACGWLLEHKHSQQAITQSVSLPTLSVNKSTIPTNITATGVTSKQAKLGTLSVSGTSTLQGSVNVQGNVTTTSAITAVTYNGQTLAISGLSTFGDVTVKTLTATGSVTVNGTIAATNISGSFNGSFTGNSAGIFVGTFNGDGSGITNIPALSCKDCVRLQQSPSTSQIGDIALTGNITVSGTISGGLISAKKGLFHSTTNESNAFRVEQTNGTALLSVDTQASNIHIGTLLPTTAGSVSSGSGVAGYSTHAATATASYPYDDSSKWTVTGNDGFARFVYSDWNDETLHLVRCQDLACSTSIDTTVETDPLQYGYDSPTIAKAPDGSLYLGYLNYTSNDHEWHIVHCLNNDCTNKTIQVIPFVVYPYSYTGSITVDGQGNPSLVFDEYDGANYPINDAALVLVHCTNTSCSAYTTSTIDSVTHDVSDGLYPGFETSTLATGPDGMIRMAYVNNLDSSLVFVRCTSYDCTTRATNIIGTSMADYYTALAIGSDGLAKIVYNGTYNNGRPTNYLACTDLDCSASTQTTIDPGLNVYPAPDIALTSQNLPIISYPTLNTLTNTYNVNYAACDDSACNSIVRKTILTGQDNDAYYPSIIIEGDGNPAILFSDTNGEIQVLKLANLAGDPVIVAGGNVGGIDLGSATERFGAIYGQNIDLQTASAAAGLSVNQKQVFVQGSLIPAILGPVAQFQIDGTTKVEINNTGALLLHGSAGQTTDLQSWLPATGSQLLGVNSSGRLYAPSTNGNQLTIGQSEDNLLQVITQSGQVLSRIDGQGNISVGNNLPPSNLNIISKDKITYITSQMAGADLNGDGLNDLVYSQFDRIAVHIAFRDHSYSPSPDYLLPSQSQLSGPLTFTDIDGDGHLDIVAPGYTYVYVPFYTVTSAVFYWHNNGNGTFAAATTYSLPGAGFEASALTDVTGDGKGDLLYTDNSGPNANLLVLPGNGDGTFGTAQTTPLTGQSLVMKAADINKDGKQDIVTIQADTTSQSPYSCKINVLLNNGNGTFASPAQTPLISCGGSYSQPSTILLNFADINSDTYPDVITLTDRQATSSDLQTFISLHTGIFATPVNYILPSTTYGSIKSVDIDDITGDNLPDILVGSDTGIVAIPALSTGGFNATGSQPIGGLADGQLFSVIADHDLLGARAIMYDNPTGNEYLLSMKYTGSSSVHVQSQSLTTNAPAVVIQQATSTSAGDLLQLQDASGTVVSKIDNTGKIIVSKLGAFGTVTSGTYGLKGYWFGYFGGYDANPPVWNATNKTSDGHVAKATTTDGPLNYPDMDANHPSTVGFANAGNQTLQGINIHWEGWVKADYTGTYTFYAQADDTVSVVVNNQPLVNNWTCCSLPESSGTINLVADQWYPISVDYGNHSFSGSVYLKWSEANVPKALVPLDHLFTTDPTYGLPTPTAAPSISVTSNLAFDSGITLQNSTSTGSALGFGLATSGTASAVTVNTVDADNVGLVVQGSSSQTADLQQWLDANGNAIASISATGTINASSTISLAAPVGKTYHPVLTSYQGGQSIFDIDFNGQTNITQADAGYLLRMGQGGYHLFTRTAGQAGLDDRISIAAKGSGFVNINSLVAIRNVNSDGTANLVLQGFDDAGTNQVFRFQGYTAGIGKFSNGVGTSPGTLTVYGSDPSLPSNIVRGAASQTADLLQAQDSSGTILASISAQGNISVKSATITGNITVNGHVITGNTSGTTTAAPGGGAGTGATCTVSGNDTSATVTITTGTAPSAATLCTISFAGSFATAPRIMLTPFGNTASTIQYNIGTTGTANFTIASNNAPAASTIYKYFYHVEQ